MLHSTHVNHVSVSPTNGIGLTQGHRKTLTKVWLNLGVRNVILLYFYYFIYLTFRPRALRKR